MQSTLRVVSITLSVCAGTTAMSDGHVLPGYEISCNKNGMVVDVSDGRTYYLGKNCDAARKGGGTGKWFSAPLGVVINLGNEAPRFEAYEWCPALPECVLSNDGKRVIKK